MIKEPKSTEYSTPTKCVCVGCGRPANHRCPHGFRINAQCDIAVCLRHFREFDRKDCITRIVNDGDSARRNDIAHDEDIAHVSSEDEAQADEAEAPVDEAEAEVDMELHFEDIDEGVQEIYDIIDSQNFLTGENVLPTSNDVCDSIHSKKSLLPVHSSNAFASHCLLNDLYGVLKRAKDEHSTARNLQMINQLVTETTSPAVSLLYPEFMMFPSIFWNGEDEKNLGAVPCHLLKTPVSTLPKRTPASPMEHTKIRLRDGDLPTSHDLKYAHWQFDLKLNNELNQQSAELMFRRGFEFFLEKDSVSVNAAETPMDFGEMDSTRKVKE